MMNDPTQIGMTPHRSGTCPCMHACRRTMRTAHGSSMRARLARTPGCFSLHPPPAPAPTARHPYLQVERKAAAPQRRQPGRTAQPQHTCGARPDQARPQGRIGAENADLGQRRGRVGAALRASRTREVMERQAHAQGGRASPGDGTPARTARRPTGSRAAPARGTWTPCRRAQVGGRQGTTGRVAPAAAALSAALAAARGLAWRAGGVRSRWGRGGAPSR